MTTTPIDQHAVEELDLYAENESALHPQYKSIIANIKRKLKSGKYSPVLAPKLWMYWYDAAAKRYCKEMGCDVRLTFPKAVREQCAAERATHEYEAIKRGEHG